MSDKAIVRLLLQMGTFESLRRLYGTTEKLNKRIRVHVRDRYDPIPVETNMVYEDVARWCVRINNQSLTDYVKESLLTTVGYRSTALALGLQHMGEKEWAGLSEMARRALCEGNLTFRRESINILFMHYRSMDKCVQMALKLGLEDALLTTPGATQYTENAMEAAVKILCANPEDNAESINAGSAIEIVYFIALVRSRGTDLVHRLVLSRGIKEGPDQGPRAALDIIRWASTYSYPKYLRDVALSLLVLEEDYGFNLGEELVATGNSELITKGKQFLRLLD